MIRFPRGLAIAALVVACTDAPEPTGAMHPPNATLLPSFGETAPTPGPSDRMLFDARAGLQQARDLEDALALWGYDDDRRRYWEFTRDADGNGTHALRVDWPGKGGSCRDVSPSLGQTLPNPLPQRVYIQWKQRLGRTASGGGHGSVGAFQVLNERCDGDRRFVWTVSREHEGESQNRRVDLRWRGFGRDAGAQPVLNVKQTPLLIAANRDWAFAPQRHINETIEHTLYAEAESSPEARDGVLRVWVNGRLLIDSAGVATGTERFRRFNFPWTASAPARNQTEYIWDVVAWEPPAVATVAVLPATVELTTGESMRVTADLRDAGGEPLAYPFVRWTSEDPTIATVSPAGVITAIARGSTTITATSQGQRGHVPVQVDRAWFVSPEGTPDGHGTRGRPWDLQTALAGGGGGTIQPGDTIWILGGVYAGEFRSTLTGTSTHPIVVRRYRDDRATIDGVLRVDGADVVFWGLEIMKSDPLAIHETGLRAFAPGARYINLIIHDASENGVSFRTTAGFSELYGSIIYNNGIEAHLDQGIYAPNDAGEKRITDNVVFNNMASGIQVFGTPDHPQVTSVRVEGNTSFNNGTISAEGPTEENITVGGSTITQDMTVLDNLLYFGGSTGQNLRLGLPGRDNRDVAARGNYVVGGATVFRMEDWNEAIIENNTFIGAARMVRLSASDLLRHTWSGNTHHRDPSARAWNYQGTLYSFEGFQTATGLGVADRALPDLPAETRVFVRPNRYERGRAHIVIFNWAGASHVAVNVSDVLRNGDRYEVHNVQDLFGPAVLSGVYTGGSLMIPMDGVSPPPAPGRPGAAPRTAPAFDAFLLTVRGAP